MSGARHKFWSDDFDMDLLKVFPDVCELLGATVDIPIWTLSHETYGRLNCPCAWNTDFGLTSFLWLEKPNLPRDEHGSVSVNGCVTNDQEIEGTWLEWLRDMWAHQQSWLLIPGYVRFSSMAWRPFEQIMWHKRGWNKSLTDAGLSLSPDVDPIEGPLKAGRLWLKTANVRFARAVESHRLGKEIFPYFATRTVPGFSQ